MWRSALCGHVPPAGDAVASGIPEFDSLWEKGLGEGADPQARHHYGFAVAFLAHDAAKAITGDTLYVDGGYHIID
jgi:enoyl-[acyl-carrier protein] reductase I